MTTHIINLESIEYRYIKDESDLKRYYPTDCTAQPLYPPNRYPCYFRQEAIIYHDDCHDDAILSYIYLDELEEIEK